MRLRYLIITTALLVFANWAIPGYRHGAMDTEFLASGQSTVISGSSGTGRVNPIAPTAPTAPTAPPEGNAGGSRNTRNADASCTGSVVVDAETPISLDSLVRASPLIMIGTVVEVFPPAYAEPPRGRSGSIHTQSLISVDQLIRGSLSGGLNRIGFAQQGGRIPPYDQSVAGDPIVKKGEQYLLFLQPDDRALPPNTLGIPRFTATGVWTGKVKIVDGKIQFSCASSPQLKNYDNTELGAFVNTLKNQIRP